MRLVIFLWTALVVFPVSSGADEVQFIAAGNITLDGPARRVTVSPDGQKVFVLTDTGTIRIYSDTGRKLGLLAVGGDVTDLATSPDGTALFLTRKGKAAIEILDVSYVRQLDTSAAPCRGKADAPVTITVFSEFQCPHCASVLPLLDQALARYPDKVKVAFKHYPLQRHPLAKPAALAAIAAQEQGRFWNLHDLFFARQNELSTESIGELAAAAGLDMELFRKSVNDPRTAARMAKDVAEATAAGVRGTPTIFVNGKLLKTRSDAALQVAIDREPGIIALPDTLGGKKSAVHLQLPLDLDKEFEQLSRQQN